MVPVAEPSSRYAPEAFDSVSVSEPSSCGSSSTGTETVFSVSPAAKLGLVILLYKLMSRTGAGGSEEGSRRAVPDWLTLLGYPPSPTLA